MINKIDSGVYTNPYNQNKTRNIKNEDTNMPSFLLDGDENGVVWDRAKSKQDDKKKLPGKKIEKDTYISSNKSETITKVPEETAKIIKEKSSQSLGIVAFAKSLIAKMKTMLKKGYEIVWLGDNNNDIANKTQNENVINSNARAEMDSISYSELDEVKRKELISQSIRDRDNGKLMEILTDNHKNEPARSTGLLTYYDRRGKIVSLDGINTNRILKGDTTTFNTP